MGDNLESLIPLPLPPERWDSRHVPPHHVYVVLRTGYWTPYMLGDYVLLRLSMYAIALTLEQLFKSILNLMPNISGPTSQSWKIPK